MEAQRIYGEIKKRIRENSQRAVGQYGDMILLSEFKTLCDLEEYLIKNFDIQVEGEALDG